MPRKSRTPAPPRRVQAPKSRKDTRSSRAIVVAAIAAGALVAVVAAAGYFLVRDGEAQAKDVATTMRDAGCTYTTYPGLQSGVHIANPDATPKQWNSFPPTSGPHYGQWVIWGDYSQPVRLAMSTHNLEHGGIVIFYGSGVGADQVEQLTRFYRDDPSAMLVAPLPKLGDKIAVTAWYAPNADKPDQADKDSKGVLAECTRYDENAFKTFRDTYRYKGPERIPPESLQPGS